MVVLPGASIASTGGGVAGLRIKREQAQAQGGQSQAQSQSDAPASSEGKEVEGKK